jgi:hypothetical protein
LLLAIVNAILEAQLAAPAVKIVMKNTIVIAVNETT